MTMLFRRAGPMHSIVCLTAGLFLFPLSSGVSLAAPVPSGQTVKLLTQQVYLPGSPVLVRVEVRNPAGARDWELWDAEAILTVDPPGVTLSTNKVTLRNGLGSAYVTLAGAGNFNLTASVNGLLATRGLVSGTNLAVTPIGGTLAGVSSTWSGVMLVTNDVIVPVGHTLTLLSNTLVLINGVASGTTANDIEVRGSIQSLGTEAHPVTITCSNPTMNWGQIRHVNAAASLYRHTYIHKAGRGTAEGHTGTCPMIRPSNSPITFETCTISDPIPNALTPLTLTGSALIGKTMFTAGGANAILVFNDTLLTRSRMGPEITGSAVLFTNSAIMEMLGPDDADGIYLLNQQNPATQKIKLIDSVFAYGGDDGIDTLRSVITVEHCIVRDWNAPPPDDPKGFTIFSGETRILRCLVANCAIAVSSKSDTTNTVITRIDRSTISGINRGIAAENKAGAAPNAIVRYFVTNCIIQVTAPNTNAVYTDYNPTNILIFHTDVVGTNWPGAGNLNIAPMFTSVPANNFHLLPGSPCIDTGDPAATDPDGSRVDLGYFTFSPPAPSFGPAQMTPLGYQFQFNAYPNRNWIVEATTDFAAWTNLTTHFQVTDPSVLADSAATNGLRRFYRAHLAP